MRYLPLIPGCDSLLCTGDGEPLAFVRTITWPSGIAASRFSVDMPGRIVDDVRPDQREASP